MKYKERYLWLSTGAVLLAIFAFIAFAPTVFAQSGNSDTDEYLQTFMQVFRFIEDYYVEETDPGELIKGALDGMFETLGDPYSYYLDVDDMANLSDTTTGNFTGVGLIISKPNTDLETTDEDLLPYVEVVTPIDGTPAYKAGISAGVFITKIEDESTETLTLDDVVDRLRGAPGTEVQVTILRAKSTEFNVSIKREVIEVPTVKHAMITDNIAYLRIIQFTPFTDNRIKDAIEEFEEHGYDSMIIDLRNNPGGLLKSVVDTSDLFLPGGTIVSTRSRVPLENQVFTANQNTHVPPEYPLVVLINKSSASASEILAGALRDHDRATVVGETSYGKGSVQQVQDLSRGGGFKLTTSRYYTPNGENIDKVGIIPDMEVKEPPLSEAEQLSLQKLTEANSVAAFIEQTPSPDESETNAFLAGLHSEGIVLEDRIIRRLIRNEVNRTNNNPPVFDLEYDLVLQKAVGILQANQVASQ